MNANTVYPKKYAHGFCCAVLCCGYTLTDFPISIRLTSLALWQSNDCPSASKATLVNMDKYFMWIYYGRLHNNNKAKHNKTVCIFLGINCNCSCMRRTTDDLWFLLIMSSYEDYIMSSWKYNTNKTHIEYNIERSLQNPVNYFKMLCNLPKSSCYWKYHDEEWIEPSYIKFSLELGQNPVSLVIVLTKSLDIIAMNHSIFQEFFTKKPLVARLPYAVCSLGNMPWLIPNREVVYCKSRIRWRLSLQWNIHPKQSISRIWVRLSNCTLDNQCIFPCRWHLSWLITKLYFSYIYNILSYSV